MAKRLSVLASLACCEAADLAGSLLRGGVLLRYGDATTGPRVGGSVERESMLLEVIVEVGQPNVTRDCAFRTGRGRDAGRM